MTTVPKAPYVYPEDPSQRFGIDGGVADMVVSESAAETYINGWTKESVTERLIGPELRDEIAEAQALGYDVSIEETPDSAYDQPERIVGMYEKLQGLGQEYASRKAILTAPKAGRVALGIPLPQSAFTKAARRAYEAELEAARDELIYQPTQGQPWHQQRGCATALLTITGAHDLAIAGTQLGEGEHRTMSGLLDKSLLNYTFERNSLSGLSLREGLIAAGERYRGKSREQSAKFTDKQLEKLEVFLDAPVTPEFKEVVEYCTDSLGIRSRKEGVSREITRYVSERKSHDPAFNNVRMLSVGCGTALPILEVAASMKEQGIRPHLILLDQDPIALGAAVQLAEKLGLEDDIEIHCERLFSKTGRPLDLSQILQGRELDVAEDSGLREYLPDRIYTALTRQIWNSLGNDGLMTTGNMNINRPQTEFLHGLMGWSPSVQMRTINDGLRLHQRAGVPSNATRVRVTQDGVYSLYLSAKQPQTTR